IGGKFIFLVCFLFNFTTISSQNQTDILLTQKIPQLLLSNTSEDYFTAKEMFLDLEKKNGTWPEQKLQLLSASYCTGDIDFFKEELLKLVKNHGFDILQLNSGLNYYDALTIGELSNWFKNNYPGFRAKWLKNNLEKMSTIKALND